MGSTNLHGVLNMPIDVWGDDYADKVQRAARYIEASKLIDKLESENADLRTQLAEARKQSDFLISNRIFVEYHEEDKEYAAMSCTCSTESGRPFVEIYGWGSTPQEAIEAAMETKGGER